MDLLLTIGVLFVFLYAILVGAPLFAIVGSMAVFFFWMADISTSAIIVEMCRLANAPGIIAIPLFTLTGYIFAESKTSDRLINLSDALLGWLPGGLAIVALVAGAIFTSLTGANGIAIIAIGGILLPALLKAKYDDNFSLGVLATTGDLGVLFVPSLPIIVYALIAKTDTVQLFIGGVVPGVLMILVIAVYAVIYAVKHEIPTTTFGVKKLLTAANQAKWEIPLPFVIIYTIYGGVITVGEAAAVTAAYAIVVECFIYREIDFKHFLKVIIESMQMVGSLLIILGVALALTNYLVDQHVPQLIMEFIKTHISSKITFLLALNLFLLIVGCLMDIFSAIIIIVPLISPVASGFGVDPTHLGIIFLANLSIGYLTPPIGMNLFIASIRFKEPVLKIFKAAVPFFILLLISLIIITYVPKLTLGPIDLLGKRPKLIDINNL